MIESHALLRCLCERSIFYSSIRWPLPRVIPPYAAGQWQASEHEKALALLLIHPCLGLRENTQSMNAGSFLPEVDNAGS